MIDAPSLRQHLARLIDELSIEASRHYGDRLVSLVVFGSVGRGTSRPDSDLDVLVVAAPLPNGRMARVADFEPVEAALAPCLAQGRIAGFNTECSPIFKTPAELAAGSPLLLDMVDDARVLVDRGGVFHSAIDRLRGRLSALGAKRIWRGSAWYWDLNPDYKPGDVIEL